jgi:hypothetical protein
MHGYTFAVNVIEYIVPWKYGHMLEYWMLCVMAGCTHSLQPSFDDEVRRYLREELLLTLDPRRELEDVMQLRRSVVHELLSSENRRLYYQPQYVLAVEGSTVVDYENLV